MNKALLALAILGAINIGLYATGTADRITHGTEFAYYVCDFFFYDCDEVFDF